MHIENKDALIIIAVVIFIFVGIFAGITLYSNHNPPFSVVVSQSMQHDNNQSQIGVIDTGDIVLVRNKSNVEIQTYIEGYSNEYSTFGDYGTVIIYRTDGGYNIIHRAMMYVEIEEDIDGKYANIPYLDEYPYKSSLDDIEKIREQFSIYRTGYRDGVAINVNIEYILEKANVGDKGYITMGDNNSTIDQCSSFIIPGVKGLISYEKIVSIPVLEIPWLGCFKLLLKNDNNAVDMHAPNSLPDLLIVTITGLLFLISLYSLYTIYSIEKIRKFKR